MDLPAALTYGSLALIVLIEALVVFLFISYYRLLKEYSALKDRLHAMEIKADQVREAEMARVREQAAQVMQQAQAQAAQIVAQSTQVSEAGKNQLESALQAALNREEQEMGQFAQRIETEMSRSLQKILHEVGAQAASDMSLAVKALEDKMSGTQVKFENTLKQSYRRADEEVEAYKQARIAQVEEVVLAAVKQVTETTLKKSLTDGQHNEIILEALAQAKKDHVL